MKKIITERVMEETIYFCDNHPNKECFTELKTSSWYGSCFDMMGIEIHLCDECLTDFYEECYKKYKIKPKDLEI
jgi:hypothetical protein